MFIVIEKFGGPEYAIICTNPDGDNMIFYTMDQAEIYAREECQNGHVVELE